MKKEPRKVLSSFGYIKVAAIVPKLRIADPLWNAKEIVSSAKEAYQAGARVLTFPELSLTGYTAGDLFHQKTLREEALAALQYILTQTKTQEALIFIGMPLVIDGMVFNVAVGINKGSIIGIVPKTSIPGYKEFYEERWFSSSRDLTKKEISLFGTNVPIGTDLLFQDTYHNEYVIAAEICEDVWTPLPPSSFYAIAGANIIVNLSASNELVGKVGYRRELIKTQSARSVCGYVYASSGAHESTTDVVFSGHAMIAENGSLLAESKRFQQDTEIIFADIDTEACELDRIKTTSFGESIKSAPEREYRTVSISLAETPARQFSRTVADAPFIPKDPTIKAAYSEEILNIQAAGLIKRLNQTGIKKVTLGLSGGLDSTLALLVAQRAYSILKIPTKNIHCITMPGLATTDRTKSNAWKLAQAIGATIEEIPINKGVAQHFADINHNGKTQDITYENTQARYRTMILMNKANQIGALVLGTGDLSEIALGWCTFSGDHLSHYNINASIPKTLVKHLVTYVAEHDANKKLHDVLIDIVDTPISPELKKTKKGEIDQKTEDIIGPYELHDFFLYYFIRWGTSPDKIVWLAEQTFPHYTKETIIKWLRVFINRFFKNQWKRSVMPDGPKVGSVALSPRGDWRMPSDAEVTAWLANLT